MKPCTRCDHTIEEHEYPGPAEAGEQRPWPCAVDGCPCTGFVVSQKFTPDNPSPQMPHVHIEETDERLRSCGFRRTLWGARRLKRAMEPTDLSSYHVRIERIGLVCWEVVAYQNKPVVQSRFM